MRDDKQLPKERAERLASIRARINAAAESTERISDEEVARHFDKRFAEAMKSLGK